MPLSDDYHDLHAEIWRRLPMGKYLLGRRRIYELAELAVGAWCPEWLAVAADTGQERVITDEIVNSVRRLHDAIEVRDHGSLWALLLSYLVHAIVQIILDWWHRSPRNRRLIVKWRKELAHV